MSWLFSQALVEEYSEGISLDGEPSAPLSVMPTGHKFWRNDKTMEPSDLSQFGLTCAVLTESHGKELLTSYLADFHVKTSASLDAELELMASDLECGLRWHGLLAKYDPVMSLWRTPQLSLLEGSAEFLETWPRSGTTRSGMSFLRQTLVQNTYANGSGLWPTPNALPASNDLNLRCSGDGRLKPNKLGWAVAEAMFPTPVASNTKAFSKRGDDKGKKREPRSYGAHGQLNPEWVEWLMGWPIGWTDLKPLEMVKFREWQQQHSICCPDDREAA